MIKKNIKINVSFPQKELRTAVSKSSYTFIKFKRTFFTSKGSQSSNKERYPNLSNFSNRNAVVLFSQKCDILCPQGLAPLKWLWKENFVPKLSLTRKFKCLKLIQNKFFEIFRYILQTAEIIITWIDRFFNVQSKKANLLKLKEPLLVQFGL